MRPLRSQHTDRPRIVCFGDSITRGIPGSSYVAYLPSHLQAENHGLGGDTLNGMAKRVDAYLKLHTPDHAVLQIGTNDILHPYLRGRSMRWKSVVQRTIEGKGIPIVEPEAFTERLAGLIEQLLPCRVSVVSIPCIGRCSCRISISRWMPITDRSQHAAEPMVYLSSILTALRSRP